MRLHVEELVCSPEVAAKLESKHRVVPDEVEAVVFSPLAHIRRGRDGLYLVYGQTDAGRYLFVVIGMREQEARVVKERRFYARQRKR